MSKPGTSNGFGIEVSFKVDRDRAEWRRVRLPDQTPLVLGSRAAADRALEAWAGVRPARVCELRS